MEWSQDGEAIDDAMAARDNADTISRLRSEVDGWKDRFKALVGEDSPDIAGNRVIDLRNENKNLCEQVAACNKAMLKLEADNAEARKLLTALAAMDNAIFPGDLMAHIRTFLAERK